MEIQGKLHVKYDTNQVSEKFARREFVVEFSDNPMYPQFIKFEVTQDKCALLDPVREGEMVDVTFNLRGREWINPQGEKKYFTSLEAWRIQKSAAVPTTTSEAKSKVPSIEELSEKGTGDFPF